MLLHVMALWSCPRQPWLRSSCDAWQVTVDHLCWRISASLSAVGLAHLHTFSFPFRDKELRVASLSQTVRARKHTPARRHPT